MTDPIKTLARKCAAAGLTLHQARHLFDALMVADACAIEGGSTGRAAQRLGVNREALHKMRRRAAAQAEDIQIPGRPDGGWVE